MGGTDRKNFERECYNNYAEGILNKTSDARWNYGSQALDACLAAPYRYVEDKFLIDLSGKTVLDYCCGTGLFSILPALNSAFVHGMDISEKSIEFAKKRADYWNVSNLTDFRQMDGESLSYENNKFDIVLSYGSMSFLDIDRAYLELARVVKDEGLIIIVDTLGHNPVLNWNRKRHIKSGNRQKYHFDHIMTLPTIKLAGKYFQEVEVRFFDLFVLFGQIIRVSQIQQLMLPILRSLDSTFLRIPPVNKLAFKFVAVLRKPQ